MFTLKSFLFSATLFLLLSPTILLHILGITKKTFLKFLGLSKYSEGTQIIITYLIFALLFATVLHFTNKFVINNSEGFYAYTPLTPAQLAALQSQTPVAPSPALAPAQAVLPTLALQKPAVVAVLPTLALQKPAVVAVAPGGAVAPAVAPAVVPAVAPSPPVAAATPLTPAQLAAAKTLSTLTPAQIAMLTARASKL